MRIYSNIAASVSDPRKATSPLRRQRGCRVMTPFHPAGDMYPDPVGALLSRRGDSVLAVIVGIEGPSYRPLGAIMAIFDDRQRVGTLSSGCIEKDIALHGLDALRAGRPAKVRYGRGSPFMDIKLPCGGGMEILLVPRPDLAVLARLADRRNARLPSTLSIDATSGAMTLAEHGPTGWVGHVFNIHFPPEIRFLVFGKGPEAGTFAALVQSAGYPNILLSPDPETLEHAAAMGCETRHLTGPAFPADISADPRTALVLFFHDHEWEPPILVSAVSRAAFYIGAQGSKRARDTRNRELEAMGIGADDLRRIHGPIGLLPSVRDARTLAISVLAEVLAVANASVTA